MQGETFCNVLGLGNELMKWGITNCSYIYGGVLGGKLRVDQTLTDLESPPCPCLLLCLSFSQKECHAN